MVFFRLSVGAEGLAVGQNAVEAHQDGSAEIDPDEATFADLAGIADGLLPADEAVEGDDEEKASEPEEGVLPPDWLREFLWLAHEGERYLSADVDDLTLGLEELEELAGLVLLGIEGPLEDARLIVEFGRILGLGCGHRLDSGLGGVDSHPEFGIGTFAGVWRPSTGIH